MPHAHLGVSLVVLGHNEALDVSTRLEEFLEMRRAKRLKRPTRISSSRAFSEISETRTQLESSYCDELLCEGPPRKLGGTYFPPGFDTVGFVSFEDSGRAEVAEDL
jgi:hypothetical protein